MKQLKIAIQNQRLTRLGSPDQHNSPESWLWGLGFADWSMEIEIIERKFHMKVIRLTDDETKTLKQLSEDCDAAQKALDDADGAYDDAVTTLKQKYGLDVGRGDISLDVDRTCFIADPVAVKEMQIIAAMASANKNV